MNPDDIQWGLLTKSWRGMGSSISLAHFIMSLKPVAKRGHVRTPIHYIASCSVPLLHGAVVAQSRSPVLGSDPNPLSYKRQREDAYDWVNKYTFSSSLYIAFDPHSGSCPIDRISTKILFL